MKQVESEVQRLNQLKASKMKELFLKKRAEVDEICKKSHMDMPYQTEMDKIMNLIMSGAFGTVICHYLCFSAEVYLPFSNALTNITIWGINEQEMWSMMIY
jgi:GH35 family endo-1,4-beta-xylanase